MEDKLAEDRVFLALTRPSVFMGLPLEAILPIIMVCMVFWGIFHNPFYPLALFGALYLPARAICHYDFNAFRLWGLWFQTGFLSRIARSGGRKLLSRSPRQRREAEAFRQ
ncbi:VirB3 family type IV secretion system protein [Sphingomonas sp. 22L2VL55-3]